MGYSVRGDYVNCWRCGPHRLDETLAAIFDLDDRATRALVATLDRRERDFSPREEIKIGKLVLPSGVEPLACQHRDYLESRGFDPDELERLWKLQGIGLSVRLAWRVFIPIHYRGDVVSWTTRSIAPDARLRYISASSDEEKINHKHLLYGADFCRHAVVVTEGPTGPWRLGPGCVATCGLGFTRPQLLRISQFPIRAICFDTERLAQQRARKLADVLAPFPGETFVIELDSEDPGTATPREVARVRKAVGL